MSVILVAEFDCFIKMLETFIASFKVITASLITHPSGFCIVQYQKVLEYCKIVKDDCYIVLISLLPVKYPID